jgi:Rod binding domain-containing protein
MQITPLNSFVPVTKPGDKADTEAQLKEAAKGFETLLTHQLVQELQKDLDGQSMFGSGVEGHTIGAMAEWELASKLAETIDLGVYEQLKAAAAARKEEK